MSFDHQRAACNATCTTLPEKAVLLVLAIMANDKGEAWPPITGPTGLTLKCSMSRRAVQLALRSLETKGHITRTSVPGRGAIYRIELGVRTTCACASDAHVHDMRTGCAPHAQGCAPHAPKQPITAIEQPINVEEAVSLKSQGKRNRKAKGSAIVQLPLVDESEEGAPQPKHFVEVWNALAARLGKPAIRSLTPERRQKLTARLAEYSVDDFRQVLANIEKSEFLRRGRFLTFDWIIGKSNFLKVLEGNYNR